jgi:hypothetical protein
MSVQPSQPSDGQPADSEGRRFSTLIGALAATPAARPETTARPTFTARAAGPTVITAPDPADTPDSAGSADPAGSGDSTDSAAAPSGGTATAPAPEPDALPAPTRPVFTPASPAGPAPADGEATRALPRPAAAPAAVDEPLLGDVDGFRARWQRAQAGFVDDPREAVGDAADLIEQTAQALVGALRQRQRQLRVLWERGPAGDTAPGNGAAAAPGADTEHLRLMMQRYRALFNQLCRP